jgi:hypothetical protein
MRQVIPRRHPRARGERGTALVEAAFVLPVVIIVALGIIELGLLFRSASVTTASSRSGARLASASYGNTPVASINCTATPTSTPCQVAKTVESDLNGLQAWATPLEMWIYKSASGDPAGGTCGTNCMKFTWSSGAFVYTSGTWTTPDACGAAIDSVGVVVKVKHNSLTGVGISRNIQQKTVMRLEPKPFGVCAGE